jgi:hypothetical protein
MPISGKGTQLNQFNASLRANEEYRAFLRSLGVNPDRPVNLSGQQRAAAERWIMQRYPNQVAGKLQVDPAGNVNTDHGVSTAWSNPAFRYPLIAGGAALTAGLINPALLGLGGAGGASGAAGGAAAGAGSAIPSWMIHSAAPAITSQGISRTIGGAAGGGLGGILGKIGGGLGKFFGSKEGIGSLASIIPALMAMKGGGPFGGGDGPNRGMDLAENAYADAQRINAMKEARFRRVDPLHEAVTHLAFNRLPVSSREGIDLTRVPLPPQRT